MNPMQNRLRRWDFLTLDSFSYGLGSKCLDLLSRYPLITYSIANCISAQKLRPSQIRQPEDLITF